MADSFDTVVIGGGPGGYTAAIHLAHHGRRVAVVERDRLGGTCLHRGCIPAKTFLESAALYEKMQRAADFGLSAASVAVDFARVAARKDRIVGANEGGVKNLLRQNGITLFNGHGRLDGPGSVIVSGSDGEQRLAAASVILATGSTPRLLPGVPADGERVVTSDHVTQWTRLPASIIVIGGGAVGTELASAMDDFGVETTLLEFLPRILPREDPEVSDVVARGLTRRGMTVIPGARVLADTVKLADSSVEVEVDVDGTRRTLSAECLLVATSRDPYSEGLGLETTRVEVERGFVKVDAQMRTAEPTVYAIGDLIGGLMLAHAAHAEGEAAVAAILGLHPRPVDYAGIPRVTYTRPELASVGLTEEEAAAPGRVVAVGRFSFRANARAMIQGESEGLVKVVADKASGEILGVHVVGPQASELIHEVALARVLESTLDEIGLTVHAHPTLSEAIAEAAMDALGRATHVVPRSKLPARSAS